MGRNEMMEHLILHQQDLNHIPFSEICIQARNSHPVSGLIKDGNSLKIFIEAMSISK